MCAVYTYTVIGGTQCGSGIQLDFSFTMIFLIQANLTFSLLKSPGHFQGFRKIQALVSLVEWWQMGMYSSRLISNSLPKVLPLISHHSMLLSVLWKTNLRVRWLYQHQCAYKWASMSILTTLFHKCCRRIVSCGGDVSILPFIGDREVMAQLMPQLWQQRPVQCCE